MKPTPFIEQIATEETGCSSFGVQVNESKLIQDIGPCKAGEQYPAIYFDIETGIVAVYDDALQVIGRAAIKVTIEHIDK